MLLWRLFHLANTILGQSFNIFEFYLALNICNKKLFIEIWLLIIRLKLYFGINLKKKKNKLHNMYETDFLSNYKLSFTEITCKLGTESRVHLKRSCPCLAAAQPGPSGRATVDMWHLPHQAPSEKHFLKRVVTGGNLAVIFLFLPLIGHGVR